MAATESTSYGDLDELRRRLPALSAIIGRSIKLARRGREHVGLCPFHREKTPSFTVSDAKRFYHCFGCGAHGDAFGWLQRAQGLSYREAIEWAKVECGLAPAADGGRRPLRRLRQAAKDAAARDDGRLERRIARAVEIWQAGAPAAGNARVKAYFDHRGHAMPAGLAARFHPDLPMSLWNTPGHYRTPALVLPIYAPGGLMQGIHVTFLAKRGPGKTSYKPARKALGKVLGGAVRLFPAAAAMALAEGLETSLGLHRATGLPVWMALTLGNMATAELPAICTSLLLGPDNDMKDGAAARAAMAKAYQAQSARGRKVVTLWPDRGKDWDDMWQAERVRRANAEEMGEGVGS